MSYVLLSDVVRYTIVISTLWLIALWLRLAWLRVTAHGWGGTEYPHPLLSGGLIFMLLVLIARRFDNLGKPGDAFMWAVLAGMIALIVGTMQSVKINWTPPWRRHNAH